MIDYVQSGIQCILGVTVILSFILLIYCIYTKQDVNTWQFPMLLALFLDSILIFSVFRRSYGIRHGIKETESDSLGRSPHRPR